MTKHHRQDFDQLPEDLKRHVESHFSRRQLAVAYDCDPETISRWVQKDELPQPILYGQRRVWTLESLEEHLRERVRKARQDSERASRPSRLRNIAGRAR